MKELEACAELVAAVAAKIELDAEQLVELMLEARDERKKRRLAVIVDGFEKRRAQGKKKLHQLGPLDAMASDLTRGTAP